MYIVLAYNEFLTYKNSKIPEYPNSNISRYDVHPWHTLDYHRLREIENKYQIKFPVIRSKDESEELYNVLEHFNSQNFESILGSGEIMFQSGLFDDIYERKINFIYPVVLYNNDLFVKYNTMDLDPKLVSSIKDKYGKLCIIQPTEGFFGSNYNDYIWVSNLQKKYGFEKDDTIIVTCNMIANDIYNDLVNKKIIDDNFTIFCYSYFQHNIWFTPGGRISDKNVKDELKRVFNLFLEKNKTEKKEFHFLSFNRVIKPHRVAIFGEIMSNENLKSKSIVTMGGTLDERKDLLLGNILWYVKDEYKHSKERLVNFFKDYDSTIHYTYDEPDLENNKAAIFNQEAHGKTFLNIVTESLIYENTVFFSEKIYKPMLAAQPFILFGNPYSLKILKKQGFQTFDKWWDESYDNETDFTKRLEKIVDVMNEISTWSLEKCFQVTNEMEDVLINNINVMLDHKELIEVYKVLNKKRHNNNNNNNEKRKLI